MNEDANSMSIREIEGFVQKDMKKGGRCIAARLQTALALLEKLRQKPSLSLNDHMPKGSSGLESHETFGAAVHKRLNLEPVNKNHGRRSSSLQLWGQSLLDILKAAGFGEEPDAQPALIDLAQGVISIHLRNILEQEPLDVRIRGRSADRAAKRIASSRHS